jgi:tRNA(fMet)-specific endonuclease VapC
LKLLSGRRSSDFAAKLLKALLHRHFSDFGHYFPTGLLFMAENSERRTENLDQVQSFLKRFDLYPISDEISRTYAQLKAKLLKTFGARDKAQRRKTRIQSLGIDDNDLWIAATALQHNLILVTVDSDFTRIQQVCNLQLESWIL